MTKIVTKIVKNTAFNAIGYFWSLVVSFFLIPFIVINIGIEQFGIWAVVGAIIGYFGLSDVAVHQPFIKYIAEAYAKEDRNEINKIITAVFIFCLVLSFLVVTIGFLVLEPLLNLFKIPPSLKPIALNAFKLGLISFGVKNLFSVFRTFTAGLQRFGVINKIGIYVSILNVVGTLIFLEKGYGLEGLMVNSIIIAVIESLIYTVVCVKLYPPLKLQFLKLDKQVFKKLLGFGFVVRATEMAGFINDSIDKLLIGHFLAMNWVGYFEVGQRAVNKFRSFLISLITPVMPAASEISALHKKEELANFYIKGTKYLNFIIFPCMMFLFFSAGMFIFLWMGYSLGVFHYRYPVDVMRILIAGMFVNFITAMGYNIAIGIAKPLIPLKAGLVILILNIGLSIPLIIKYGFYGTVVGGAIALFVGSIVFIFMFNKWLNVSNIEFIKQTIVMPLIATIVAGIVTYIFRMGTLWFYLEYYSIANGIKIFVVCGIVFMSVYLYVIIRSNYFDKVEREFLKSLWRKKFSL